MSDTLPEIRRDDEGRESGRVGKEQEVLVQAWCCFKMIPLLFADSSEQIYSRFSFLVRTLLSDEGQGAVSVKKCEIDDATSFHGIRQEIAVSCN